MDCDNNTNLTRKSAENVGAIKSSLTRRIAGRNWASRQVRKDESRIDKVFTSDEFGNKISDMEESVPLEDSSIGDIA